MARAQTDLSRWDIGPIQGSSRQGVQAPALLSPAPRLPVAAPRVSGAPIPVVEHRPTARASFVWVGAHGGAGISSLATVSGEGLELSQAWPAPALGWPRSVALVCRTSASGLDDAARFLHAWAAHTVPDIDVIALVTVADSPGRLPKTLRTRIHELSGVVPTTLTVPWIPAWRETPRAPHTGPHRTAAAVMALVNKENNS